MDQNKTSSERLVVKSNHHPIKHLPVLSFEAEQLVGNSYAGRNPDPDKQLTVEEQYLVSLVKSRLEHDQFSLVQNRPRIQFFYMYSISFANSGGAAD
ncbi:hypothetical protein OUZ56_032131 [Daphnia magna]|uniref:Uncharacterized protein n=1 Tax=Daphnia magna TaxID=35525 RepID=A0ABQ9ZW80_9CRUS|nr:hypothetical protein OUZ56_032131 [Daphnia magna]